MKAKHDLKGHLFSLKVDGVKHHGFWVQHHDPYYLTVFTENGELVTNQGMLPSAQAAAQAVRFMLDPPVIEDGEEKSFSRIIAANKEVKK